MTIAKGVSLGPYQVLGRIGSGGMGEVWRARDRRIRRDVAVKVLPPSFGVAGEHVQRFEQEARAAGALNHPGLVTIFDIGTANQSPYIVMELLEGQTLREIIGETRPAPLPCRKAIDYGIQIASALAVAHDKGIIHRDLKPENLFVMTDGRVKILDFGLAKLAQNVNDADSAGRTGRHLTASGIVVGTPGYMSPEQVRAQPLDHRTDIFSLGAVLYEMLCGEPAFDCPSSVETMHAVLSTDPIPLTTRDPALPPALEAIVSHCLEKNPRDRFQSAHDLAFQLRTLRDMQITAPAVRRALPAEGARANRRRLAVAGIAVLALVAAGGVALDRARRATPEGAPRTFRQLTFSDGVEMFPTFAPDGKSFAYVSSASGNRDIYVQRVDGRTGLNLTGDSPADDTEPAFSPDGGQIAFRSEREGGGIFVMGVTGESVRRISDFGHNPAWSPDGVRLVVSTRAIGLRPHVRIGGEGELWILDTRTGAKRPIAQAGVGGPDFGRNSDAVQPSWSPHGKRIAFWGQSNWAGQRDLWTIDPDAPQPKKSVTRITADAALQWNPVWSHDGKYLYYGSNADGTLNLWRIPIDENSGIPSGAPEPVPLPASVSGHFAFSQTGEMIFTTVTRSYQLLALPFDAETATTGTARTVHRGSQEILSFDPSPDGQSIAFGMGGTQEDLFIASADGSRMRQLTNDPARDRDVAWSPDGKTLYFVSDRSGAYRIWSIRADGSGLAPMTDESGLRKAGMRNLYSPRVSPDGRTLVVSTERRLDALLHTGRPLAQRLEPIGEALGLQRWSPSGSSILGFTKARGIQVYSTRTRRAKMVRPRGNWPQWLPGERKIVFFEDARIGVLDLDTKREVLAPFAAIPGAELDETSALSRDGATLYVRQRLEQGDIWLMKAQIR